MSDLCAYCCHPQGDHRRRAGGKLFICRKRVMFGTAYDTRLCGCRAFRPEAAG